MSNQRVSVELALKGLEAEAEVNSGASLDEFAKNVATVAGNAVEISVKDALQNLSSEAEAENDLGGSFWGEGEEKLNIEIELSTGKVLVSTK